MAKTQAVLGYVLLTGKETVLGAVKAGRLYNSEAEAHQSAKKNFYTDVEYEVVKIMAETVAQYRPTQVDPKRTANGAGKPSPRKWF